MYYDCYYNIKSFVIIGLANYENRRNVNLKDIIKKNKRRIVIVGNWNIDDQPLANILALNNNNN